MHIHGLTDIYTFTTQKKLTFIRCWNKRDYLGEGIWYSYYRLCALNWIRPDLWSHFSAYTKIRIVEVQTRRVYSPQTALSVTQMLCVG